MKHILVFVALVSISMDTSAHNPNTASVVFSPTNGVWVAQFTISQEGASYALNKYYTDTDLSSIDADTYKTLYIDYLRKKMRLMVDNQEVKFSSAGIKLGGHQTDIKFLLPDFPKNYKEVYLKLPIFEENEGQHTVVKFVTNTKSIRKVMSRSNSYDMHFENNDTEFIGIGASKSEYSKTIFGFILSILIFLGIYISRKRYKQKGG
ncbi:MAG: hypothetical protein HRT67_01880 [Flavobacteriaceae bacterium]|nr:hypothetical protein [Flavobacteriaceae bacterium]